MFAETILSAIGTRPDLLSTYPEHFRFDGDYRVTVSWQIQNDPERPNKRSKTLAIILSREACVEWRDSSEQAQVVSHYHQTLG